MKLKYQKRNGLFQEHRRGDLRQAPHERVRLTIPAREALESAGAIILAEPSDGGPALYTVELMDRVPQDVVATRIIDTDHLGLRMSNEPEYPGEIWHAYWEQLDFTPCPKCGAPLIWYEAGYVPGYRVCARKPHHHILAS